MVSLVKAMTGDFPARPVLVFSNRPEAQGLQKAKALGVVTASVDHRPFGKDRAAFEAELSAHLDAAKTDIVCLAGFMRIFTDQFMTSWEGRMLNVHPSLLPKYKGLHPQQQALDAGDKESGCTVHSVTPELDGGPILGQASVPILAGDTAATLAARILPMEHVLYPAVLKSFATGNNSLLTL